MSYEQENNSVNNGPSSEPVSGQYYNVPSAAPVYIPVNKKSGRVGGSIFGRLCRAVYKVFIVSLICFGLLLLGTIVMYMSGAMISSQVIEPGDKFNRIAVIDLEGMIDMDNAAGFTQLLKTAAKDDTVKGVIISVNSPGGMVVPSDMMAHEIAMFREKSGKPVFVSVQQLSASGAYWATAACDRIFAQMNSMVGSIGVIYNGFVVKDTLDKVGIAPITVKSSRSDMKDKGSMFRMPTELELADIQADIDKVHDRFIDVVAGGRKLSRTIVIGYATGDVFDGQEAVTAGLIDEIGYLDDVITSLSARLNIEKPQVFRMAPADSLRDLLMEARATLSDPLDFHSQYLQLATTPRIQVLWLGN
ncbi:MAG: signal peptide peptidase SppA [Sedimentisphaerales bacterium]|nr:signal peptide peptidase SppA [Sedimentisphaerales bacterium]MBN2843972.1 signal peptide peptidase SppA [Sedimentisphaerales bacterium]